MPAGGGHGAWQGKAGLGRMVPGLDRRGHPPRSLRHRLWPLRHPPHGWGATTGWAGRASPHFPQRFAVGPRVTSHKPAFLAVTDGLMDGRTKSRSHPGMDRPRGGGGGGGPATRGRRPRTLIAGSREPIRPCGVGPSADRLLRRRRGRDEPAVRGAAPPPGAARPGPEGLRQGFGGFQPL